MAFSSYQRSRLSKVAPPEEEEEDNMRPMPRSGSVRAFSHLPEQEAPPQPQEVLRRSSGIHPYNAMSAPDHALPFQAMDEDSADSYSPASRYAEEPPSDDEAPEGDASSFHAPQNLAPSLVQDAPTARQTSGLMLRPRPMPPEYARQQARGSMANSIPYGSKPATTDADAPPETQHLDTPTDQRGFPQDNRPLETTLNTPVTTASRGLQQRQAPGAPILQAARDAGQQPPGMQRFQAVAPAQQKQVGGNTTPPTPQAPKQAQPPAPKNAANTGQSAEKTPDPQQQIKVDASNPYFETAARTALADEADNSPVAAALQKEAARLGISIVPQKGLKMSETKLVDGKPVIHFNPNPLMKTDTTMSHEITHAIQTTAYQQVINDAIKGGKKIDQNVLNAATKAGQEAVAKIVPVHSTNDTPNDRRENEAMRMANIVNAERTASEMKNLPEEQKTLAEFQRRQAEKEKARGEPEKGRKHPNNTHPMPEGTERGQYDNQYVRDVLGLDEKGQKKSKPTPPSRP